MYDHYKSKLENFNANKENQDFIQNNLGAFGVTVKLEENLDGGIIGTITGADGQEFCRFFDQKMFDCFKAGWNTLCDVA